MRSFEPGRKQKKTAADYIELINRCGVDFSPTREDEERIRRLGKYLGKKGLDNLIAAINNNYRESASSDAPSSSPSDDSPLSFLREIPIKGGSPHRLDALMRAAGYTGPTSVTVLIVANSDSSPDQIIVGTRSDLNTRNSQPLYAGESFNFPGGEDITKVYVLSAKDTKIDVTYRPKSLSGTALPSPLPKERPDISLRIVHPQSISLLIVNNSNIVLREPFWYAAMWNLDREKWNEPLPIPTATGGWIRPHEAVGPMGFITQDRVLPLIKQGDRLFGVIQVTCPDCIRTKAYWVYVIHGSGGWFAELSEGHSPNLNAIFKLLPEIRKNPDAFFSDIPPEQRITIKDFP